MHVALSNKYEFSFKGIHYLWEHPLAGVVKMCIRDGHFMLDLTSLIGGDKREKTLGYSFI